MVCKTCGADGSDTQNKLCRQGNYTLPWCWRCMNEACRKAGESSLIIKASEQPDETKNNG